MLTLDFLPFPVLETERLLLRRLDSSDVNEIFELRSNPETMKYIPRPLVKNHEDALKHFKTIDDAINNNLGINWAVTLKGNPKLLGIMGFYRIQPENFRAEIGYMILPEFNGKGIVSEAIPRILEYGFTTMKLHSVEAVIDPDNIASERVLKKCNFEKEAHFKENEYFDGKFWDSVVYSILNKK
ncbi:GNAT family N-acetyltransferase [Flavobacterium soli]|uniref:GNAT family N-acetyltransferase n=1 Tax=Flavobacterium soli TaxID=344881 RepID=UPI000428EC16|nr:GNAT family N-acetyltransferase [Flavobacterium soli]